MNAAGMQRFNLTSLAALKLYNRKYSNAYVIAFSPGEARPRRNLSFFSFFLHMAARQRVHEGAIAALTLSVSRWGRFILNYFHFYFIVNGTKDFSSVNNPREFLFWQACTNCTNTYTSAFQTHFTIWWKNHSLTITVVFFKM